MSKYGNRKMIVDGHVFDSQLEANRYQELLLLEKAGLIKDLILQPKFILIPRFRDATGKHQRAISYVADFQYWDNEARRVIVEDSKGFSTDVFKLKFKLFLYYHPKIELRIIK